MGWRKTALCVVVAAGTALAGCNSYGSYCEAYVDCVGGNEQDEEACVIRQEAEEEKADIDGCTDDYSELFDCQEESFHCTGDNDWTDDDKCQEQEEKLGRCR